MQLLEAGSENKLHCTILSPWASDVAGAILVDDHSHSAILGKMSDFLPYMEAFVAFSMFVQAPSQP